MRYPNYRGVKKVLMITVLEGRGTEENPYRELKYIYDPETNKEIGSIGDLLPKVIRDMYDYNY